MDTSMNKKHIAYIRWPDGSGIETQEGSRLIFAAIHHGDHNEFWIVQEVEVDGLWDEVARHNPKYIETIGWSFN